MNPGTVDTTGDQLYLPVDVLSLFSAIAIAYDVTDVSKFTFVTVIIVGQFSAVFFCSSAVLTQY